MLGKMIRSLVMASFVVNIWCHRRVVTEAKKLVVSQKGGMLSAEDSKRPGACRLKAVNHVSTYGEHGVSFYNLMIHQSTHGAPHNICWESCSTFSGPVQKQFQNLGENADYEFNRGEEPQYDLCNENLHKSRPNVILVSTVKRLSTILYVADHREELGNPRLLWQFHFNWDPEEIRAQTGEGNIFTMTDILKAYNSLTSQDTLVYASQSCKDFWERVWWSNQPRSPARVTIIPPAVDRKLVQRTTEGWNRDRVSELHVKQWETAETLRVRDDEIVFVQAGQVNTMKNQQLSMRAVQLWHDRNPDKRAHLVLVGLRTPPPEQLANTTYLNQVISMAKTINTANSSLRVSLVGMLDQPTAWKVISIADVFLFPTRVEVFGMVPLEAMSTAGSPTLIASKDGGFPCSDDGFVKDMRTGLCFVRNDNFEEDVTRMAQAISKAIDDFRPAPKDVLDEVKRFDHDGFTSTWSSLLLN